MKKEKPALKLKDMLDEVEKTLEKLESGELDIDEAIKEYEKGMELIKKCSEVLKQSRLRIETLRKKGEKDWERTAFEEEEEEEDAEDEDDEKDKGLF